MQKALKRSFIVLVAVVTMIFTCVLMPKQKAEASLLLVGGVALGTAVAIGLIGYGIGVSSDDPEEDTYLAMACDKLTEYAAGQGINKWNLNHYLTNATWFWTAMAEVASWFYEQNLVFNEVYEPLISSTSYLDGAAAGILSVSNTTNMIDQSITVDDCTYKFLLRNYLSTTTRDFYFFLDSSNELYIISNLSQTGLGASWIYTFSESAGNCYFYFLNDTGTRYNNYFYENFSTLYPDFDVLSVLKWFGISLTAYTDASYTVENFIDSLVIGTVEPTSPGISVDFPQRLFESPADVLDITGSMESYKIDSTKDVIDFGNAEELTELKTFDATLDKVLSGELTADQVITAVGAQPYVLTDAETGEIATTDTPAENVKPVALEGDLSIPQDLVAEDTYTPTNTSTDTDKPKNRFNFPLSEFFPFCLPFDIYDFLTFFAADPVAPVIEIPIGEFFSAVPGVTEETTGYIMRLDLGDENFAKWFEILRLLESLGIIIGLIMVSRKLIHGGN